MSAATVPVPIARAAWRRPARVSGRVRSMTMRSSGGVPTLECVVVDDTGGLTAVFLGRAALPGVGPGARVVLEGVVGERHGHLAMVNPAYELTA